MNLADTISASQSVIATASKLSIGPLGAGYVNFLLGQGNFVAQISDLGYKIKNEKANPADYADVIKSAGDIIAGLGVLTSSANPIVLSAWAATGIGLFLYKT